ncbi:MULTISPECIES: SGNH/GDSL hydrolase family protein [unclassified Microbacterium]|uniref:SGNH/GDSL hydrolase family protein n=1 Tax=unclassified Microbacterium TaxID=2609290 RepID=UPI0031F65FF1
MEAAAPHVTVVEFFNDAYLDPADWAPAYDELVSRLTSLGSEVVLLTPTFAMRAAMNGSAERDDGRPYVHFLRDHAQRAGLPLIDVSARWERLRDEGLPYWTLLANGINHPDDRGHRLTGGVVARALEGMLEARADA